VSSRLPILVPPQERSGRLAAALPSAGATLLRHGTGQFRRPWPTGQRRFGRGGGIRSPEVLLHGGIRREPPPAVGRAQVARESAAARSLFTFHRRRSAASLRPFLRRLQSGSRLAADSASPASQWDQLKHDGCGFPTSHKHWWLQRVDEAGTWMRVTNDRLRPRQSTWIVALEVRLGPVRTALAPVRVEFFSFFEELGLGGYFFPRPGFFFFWGPPPPPPFSAISGAALMILALRQGEGSTCFKPGRCPAMPRITQALRRPRGGDRLQGRCTRQTAGTHGAALEAEDGRGSKPSNGPLVCGRGPATAAAGGRAGYRRLSGALLEHTAWRCTHGNASARGEGWVRTGALVHP